MHSEADLLQRAMDLGGKGYIVQESALLDIVNGIRSVAVGRPFVSPSMTAALLDRRALAQALARTKPGFSEMTPSDRRILGMIAPGKPTKAIHANPPIHPPPSQTPPPDTSPNP